MHWKATCGHIPMSNSSMATRRHDQGEGAEDKEKDAKEEEEEEEEDADEEDEERETDKEAEDAEEGEGEEQEDAEDEEAEGAEEGEGVEKEEAKDAAEGEEGEKEDAEEEEEEAEDAEDEEARKEKEGAEDKEAEDAEEGEEGEKQQEGAEDKEVEDAEEGEEGEEEDEEEEEEAEDAEEGEEKEKEGTEDEEAEDAEEGEEGEKEVAKDEEAEDAEEGEEGEKEDAKDEEAKDAEEGEEGEKEEAEDAEAKDAEEGEGKEKKGAEEEEAEDAEEGEEGEKEVAEDEEAEDAEECEEGEKEVTEDEEAEDAEEGEEGEQEGAKVKEAEDAEEGEGEKEVAEGDEEKENNAEGKLQGRGGGDVKQSIIPDWALEAFPGMTAASVAKLVKLATDAYHKELSDQAQSSSSGTKRGEAQSDLRNDPEAVARKKQKTKSSQAERMFEVSPLGLFNVWCDSTACGCAASPPVPAETISAPETISVPETAEGHKALGEASSMTATDSIQLVLSLVGKETVRLQPLILVILSGLASALIAGLFSALSLAISGIWAVPGHSQANSLDGFLNRLGWSLSPFFLGSYFPCLFVPEMMTDWRMHIFFLAVSLTPFVIADVAFPYVVGTDTDFKIWFSTSFWPTTTCECLLPIFPCLNESDEKIRRRGLESIILGWGLTAALSSILVVYPFTFLLPDMLQGLMFPKGTTSLIYLAVVSACDILFDIGAIVLLTHSCRHPVC
eukprot:g33700.t1